MSDEEEAVLGGPHDHPVIATLIGCVMLVAAAILVPRMLPAYPQTMLIAAGAAAGLVLWAIGMVATTRRSTLGWKAGSLAILLGSGALAGQLVHRQYDAGGRQDPSSFAEIEFGPQGAPILPQDAAARGPVSKLFALSVQAAASERRAYDEALGKFGASNLNSPYLLSQNQQILSRCGDLEAIKTLALENAATRQERRAAIAREIQVATLDAALKEAIAAMALPDPQKTDALYQNQIASLDATAELCALLAKRSWEDANGYFSFGSGSDAARYKSLQRRRAMLASEAEQLDKDAVARMKAAQEKVRAALS